MCSIITRLIVFVCAQHCMEDKSLNNTNVFSKVNLVIELKTICTFPAKNQLGKCQANIFILNTKERVLFYHVIS